MRVQQNVESAVLNRLDNFLNKDLPSLETVDNRCIGIPQGMQQAEDEANEAPESSRQKSKVRRKRRNTKRNSRTSIWMKIRCVRPGTLGPVETDSPGRGSTIEKDVRGCILRRKVQKNSKHIN